MNISSDALVAHVSALYHKVSKILDGQHPGITAYVPGSCLIRIKYGIASYPVPDMMDEAAYQNDGEGRDCRERELEFSRESFTISSMLSLFDMDIRVYGKTVKDGDNKEYAIASNFILSIPSAGGMVATINVSHYDLRLLPSATHLVARIRDFVGAEGESFLFTGNSFHIVSGKPIDDRIPILKPGCGLLDDVWDAISGSVGVSYLRVTHNIKPLIVKVPVADY